MHLTRKRKGGAMDDVAGTKELDYASDLQLIKSMHEDDSFWDRIFDAKLDFLNNGGDPRQAGCVRPEIAESWINSRNFGLNPDQPDLGEYITEQAYEETLAENAEIVAAAKSLIRNIESLNLQNDYMFELLDVNGTPLVQIGNLWLHRFAGPNYQCNESNMGTNAHTLCMRHKKPFVLIGPEHYCFALHGLIACAAPIIDQFGASVGALALTQPTSDELLSTANKKILIHAMSLVSSLAITLSDQLRISGYDAQLAETESRYSKASLEAQRYETISQNLMNTVKDGILICDAGDTISLATPEAARIFKTSPEELLGTNVNALINDSRTFEEVIEQGGHSTFDVDGMPLEAKISRIYGGDHDFEDYIIALKEAKRATLGASRGKLGDAADITFKDILGKSYQITKAKKLASRFARSRENILLSGESGTGKELFAQAIHNQACPEGPFMSINCAAIPPRLIESELFGYESGSFTGAERGGKPGKIELADGGTLFLDEIGDMPLELQATLLRVLENKRIIRVGGKSYKQIDFRLVAGAHRRPAPAARPRGRCALLRALLPQRVPHEDGQRQGVAFQRGIAVREHLRLAGERAPAQACHLLRLLHVRERRHLHRRLPQLHRPGQRPAQQRGRRGGRTGGRCRGPFAKRIVFSYQGAGRAGRRPRGRGPCRDEQDAAHPLPQRARGHRHQRGHHAGRRQHRRRGRHPRYQQGHAVPQAQGEPVALLRRTAALLRAAGPGSEKPIGLEMSVKHLLQPDQ